MTKGAAFSDIGPRTPDGLLRNQFSLSLSGSPGVDYSTILQATPNNSFRLGQQLLLWVGIYNPQVFLQGQDLQPIPGSENWVTRLRVKPWWARPNFEYRQAYGGNGRVGSTAVEPIDRQNFAGSVLANNRYVWIPSPKRLDLTPFEPGPNPPASPVRNSDSVMLDECWVWDLDNPTNPPYAAAFPPPFLPSRWSAFFQPAFGYALGLTWESEYARVPVPGVVAEPRVDLSLTYAVGTLGGGLYQESVG